MKKMEMKITKYPDDAILHAMTKRHGELAKAVACGLTDSISAAHYASDFFCVLLYCGEEKELVGYANFYQGKTDPAKWFYADLWVAPEHRRQGFARKIVSAGLQQLSELCAGTLRCTVKADNTASLHLHRSLGFAQIETEPFDDFFVEGFLMFRRQIPMDFNIVPLADGTNQLPFICDLLTTPSNVSALHLKQIPKQEYPQFFQEMRKALVLEAEENERNYIVRKGIVPVAWLKLDGLNQENMWVSMLIVHDKYRKLGVGMFALKFAEELAVSISCKNIYVHSTEDNQGAQMLYKRAGYEVVNEEAPFIRSKVLASDKAAYRDENGTETVRCTV